MDMFYLLGIFYTFLFLTNTALSTFATTSRGFNEKLLFALGIVPVIQIIPIIISLYKFKKLKNEAHYNTY